MKTFTLPLSKLLKSKFLFLLLPCTNCTAAYYSVHCHISFVTISSQICSCQNGTSTANVELQKYNLNCTCGAANVSCYILMQLNCKCVNSICGLQDMCQLQKGRLLKCEQQMCSCKSVELLMFQWHMNKTANVVTAKDFNCLCIQLQMCYQQMYDLQMKNCICSSGQCRFTLLPG